MKNKREIGITLVALVVTIIILLILAGITISQLTDNGLFENAKIAKQEYENAQQKEDKLLEDYENQIENYNTWQRAGDSTGTVIAVEDESLLDISTYSSEGLTIYDERIKDLQGGYRIVGNIVYVYIEATANKDLTKSDSWRLINNLPTSKTSQPIPFQSSACSSNYSAFRTVSTAFIIDHLTLAVGSKDISTGEHITIMGKYLKATE